MSRSKKLRRFTVLEYEQMARDGILGEEERVELINGEILQMSPIGMDHAGTCAGLHQYLTLRLGDRALVWGQSPVRMMPRSMPQPDITILKPREDTYRSAYPVPEDVLLVIEISDSSLGWDRITKGRLYAKEGIPEYWIVNLRDRCVEVSRGPSPIGYTECRKLVAPDVLRPLAFPDVEIPIEKIFG